MHRVNKKFANSILEHTLTTLFTSKCTRPLFCGSRFCKSSLNWEIHVLQSLCHNREAFISFGQALQARFCLGSVRLCRACCQAEVGNFQAFRTLQTDQVNKINFASYQNWLTWPVSGGAPPNCNKSCSQYWSVDYVIRRPRTGPDDLWLPIND